MHILNNSTGSQVIYIIPRYDFDEVDVTITDEETENSIVYNVTASMSANGYQMLEDIYTLEENKKYRFKVIDRAEGDTAYRGTIFCTNFDGNFDNFRGVEFSTGSNDTIILI